MNSPKKIFGNFVWLRIVWLALICACVGLIATAQTLTPTITSLLPSTIAAGGPSFILTVNGTDFSTGVDVFWNGTRRETTYVSPNQLRAIINAEDIVATGTVQITAVRAVNFGGVSNALPFTITQAVPPAPFLTSLSPVSATEGSASFTLTLNGRAFTNRSVARWNGANRPTTFVSNTQLMMQVSATDLANVGTAAITVFTAANDAGAGGGISNALAFTIAPRPLPAPVLNSVTAAIIGQGARQVRLTLLGTNFRPGARVIIGQTERNTALVPANDIAVESVQRVSDTMLYVMVSASSQAALNARSVDVVNTDNSNTAPRGSNTTKLLNVQAGSSLGAPLQITNLLIVHPRTGTVVSQNEPLFAEAVLTGAGSGTVIGQWLWDGQITEQFAVQLIGGERVTLKTQNPLPTAFLGTHQLSLKITAPNQIQTAPVTVIVNHGTWQMLRLMAPSAGKAFKTNAPPRLRWTLVPGAAKYQVAFSSQPYFNSLKQWHDVTNNEWQVPDALWNTLPEGELFWTVRVVETAGNQRTPAPMRRILHFNANALEAIAAAPEPNTSASATKLAWQPVRLSVIYRVTVSSDTLGKLVIRRFATANSSFDVKSLGDKFQEGVLYHWRVEAFSLKGRMLMQSEPQSFVPRPARSLQDLNFNAPIGPFGTRHANANGQTNHAP